MRKLRFTAVAAFLFLLLTGQSCETANGLAEDDIFGKNPVSIEDGGAASTPLGHHTSCIDKDNPNYNDADCKRYRGEE